MSISVVLWSAVPEGRLEGAQDHMHTPESGATSRARVTFRCAVVGAAGKAAAESWLDQGILFIDRGKQDWILGVIGGPREYVLDHQWDVCRLTRLG
jgi:hypothetical protein